MDCSAVAQSLILCFLAVPRISHGIELSCAISKHRFCFEGVLKDIESVAPAQGPVKFDDIPKTAPSEKAILA